jgi:acyl-CoA thioester hydrolase
MTAVYERAFRVRFYECDAYNHVNHANYARYMQEAAMDASAAIGYDTAYYRGIDRYWLVCQTGITYLRPLAYGDTVIVKTWVADFRRATSRRLYEMRIKGSDKIAAEGFSDWVFVNSMTSRPARVPPSMVAAFTPPQGLRQTGKRETFPIQPPQPEGVFRMRRRVRWSEIDAAGHVNNAAYFSFMEDCAMELMAARDWTAARMHDEGFGIVARSYRIQYMSPALLDDELEVSTWVSQVKRSSAVRHYTITRAGDGEVIARAQAVWVWVNLQTGGPMRIPAEFLSAFAANVSGS